MPPICGQSVVDLFPNRSFIMERKGVFGELLRTISRIPNCSLYGHYFDDEIIIDDDDKGNPKTFYPILSGSIGVIVIKEEKQIQELLRILKDHAATDDYSRFDQENIGMKGFPQKDSIIQYWELVISPGRSIVGLPDNDHVSVKDYPNKFIEVQDRVREKEDFWENLNQKLTVFCVNNDFGEPDVEARIKEISDVWRSEE